MTKLYIIGNGFDRYHDLPTNYSDFHIFVNKTNHDLENTFEEYFTFNVKQSSNNQYLWTNFEYDLSTFNSKAFFDDINQIDILDENFKPSYLFALEDDLEQETEILLNKIRDAFENWLTDLNLESAEKKLDLEENSLFLSFNYTMTLEEVYQISSEKILHIHGDVENDQGSMIFGHNKTVKKQPLFDENSESTRTPFSDSEANAQQTFFALQKPVKDTIRNNHSFFKSLSKINDIIVLGHSLNSIDMPYFKMIKKYSNEAAKWKISYYSNDEKARHLKSLRKIGIQESRIEFFKMSDYDLL
ncbi:bacteriophage abortive infection AbiH family protein [Chryseobacterium geocarposphaerae]|uniref:Abortive infection AbiH-like protein n=1 Tax=Chryseobacterium geocarposphaerae TaxID=1416776 RepID=A0A2M9C927_9FLAO|nr:bacteriophage abortive infection AbiH family protein [Chryseobacterium geocarposphaerae]PJJ67337.1 abortive infection AbiH-like protein [Chryseobacterium geocarposphaerae]